MRNSPVSGATLAETIRDRYRTKSSTAFPCAAAIAATSQHRRRSPCAMFTKSARAAAMALLTITTSAAASVDDGVVKVRSAYPMTETIDRIRQDVAAKGITFFSAID